MCCRVVGAAKRRERGCGWRAAMDPRARGQAILETILVLPLFIFVVPGVIAYVLAQRGALRLDDPDSALPTLIGSLLPAGLRGLVVAGLLAALMSSLSSVFNSCATLVTMDVYKRLAPHHSERRGEMTRVRSASARAGGWRSGQRSSTTARS